MIVYGIDTGCIYEGGSTEIIMYKKYENAKSRALELLKEKIEDDKERDKKFPTMPKHKKWKATIKKYGINRYWTNGMDYISICEYEIK